MQRTRGQKSFFVRSSGQLNLNITDWGGSGVPIILIHGLAEGSYIWDDFVSEFAQYARVLTIDLRGHGRSDWDVKKEYTFSNHVDDVGHVIDELLLQEYILVGHSLGGGVAAKLLEIRGPEVLATVLVDTGPSEDLTKDKYVHDQIHESYRAYKSPAEYVEWMAARRLLVGRHALEHLAKHALVFRDANGYWPRFDLAVAKIALQHHDQRWWWSALAGSCVPVLIVRGVGSAILPQQVATQMAKAAPKGQLAVVELAGHSVMSDNPAGFLKAVRPFLLDVLRASSAVSG